MLDLNCTNFSNYTKLAIVLQWKLWFSSHLKQDPFRLWRKYFIVTSCWSRLWSDFSDVCHRIIQFTSFFFLICVTFAPPILPSGLLFWILEERWINYSRTVSFLSSLNDEDATGCWTSFCYYFYKLFIYHTLLSYACAYYEIRVLL